ncbi:MAG TPA: hypothetical protein PLL92_11450 [Alicycliphilus sp.]|nr:hypothetical protein [Alicycliphilus sp.]
MNSMDIIYSLCVDDVQTVAQDVLGRTLSDSEVFSIVDLVGERISWFDAIEDSIRVGLGLEGSL